MSHDYLQLVATDEGLGRIEGDLVALFESPFGDFGEVLRSGANLLMTSSARITERKYIGTVKLACPLSRPTTIWGVGLNYRSKAAATGRPLPLEPILFFKPGPAMCGPNDPIVLPSITTDEVDYEAELAVVIGSRLSDVSPSSAARGIAGYTTANDMTLRDVMTRTGQPSLAKGFPSFAPVGPSIVPFSELGPNPDLAIRSFVNGELRQSGRTSELIFPIPTLIAEISKYTVLEPGDLILTGTPPGTGQDLSSYLHAGDRVDIEIDGMLPLSNLIKSGGCTSGSVPNDGQETHHV